MMMTQTSTSETIKVKSEDGLEDIGMVCVSWSADTRDLVDLEVNDEDGVAVLALSIQEARALLAALATKIACAELHQA